MLQCGATTDANTATSIAQSSTVSRIQIRCLRVRQLLVLQPPGALQHFGLCFASICPSLQLHGLVRFGLVLITYATKLCQLMERGTAAGAAAFAFNRICCADYRYLDIVLTLIGAQSRSMNQAHKKNKITCCVILYVCVGVRCTCVCVSACGRG